LVGLCEWNGALVNAKGIDLEDVMTYRKNNGGKLEGYPKAKYLKNSHAGMEVDCDILIPAALENQITAENAPRIKAKIIGEGANGPVTPEAEDILNKKGVMVIPDMYLNAGGVTVSYFEWLKNLSHVRFGRMDKRFQEYTNENFVSTIEGLTGKRIDANTKEMLTHGADEIDMVNSGLEETMISSYNQIRNAWKKNSKIKDLRTAAFVVAISKVAESYQLLGIWP